MPPEFQRELEQTALELQNGVNCPQAPEEERDEGRGKGKKKGQDEETTTIGTTVSTTEEGK